MFDKIQTVGVTSHMFMGYSWITQTLIMVNSRRNDHFYCLKRSCLAHGMRFPRRPWCLRGRQQWQSLRCCVAVVKDTGSNSADANWWNSHEAWLNHGIFMGISWVELTTIMEFHEQWHKHGIIIGIIGYEWTYLNFLWYRLLIIPIHNYNPIIGILVGLLA